MRVLLLLFLLMPLLVHAQVGDGVAGCCGARTEELDLTERTDGFAHNLLPLDSVRFGQPFSRPDYGLGHSPPVEREAEASYGTPFVLYNLDEGGYNPGTGSYTPSKETNPEWYKSDKEWASQNLKKYWDLR